MRRTLPTLATALALGLGAASASAPAPAVAQQQDGGTQIGGTVASTLSLDLAQTGATVRAVVTTTEPDARLSVAPAAGEAGLRARVAGPYAPVNPAFGLTLAAWDDVLAGRATTLSLKTTAPAASAPTVLITLSTVTP